MDFKGKLEAIKTKLQAKIKPESSADEVKEINDTIAELEELSTMHNDVLTENAKFKDTIVRIVSTEGNGKAPQDDSGASKSMSIEEAFAKVQGEK